MRQLFGKVILLLPSVLTLAPLPESVFPMYYLAPTWPTACTIFMLALVISYVQLVYQYWAIGQVEELAPRKMSRAGVWLQQQPIVQAIQQRTGLMLFLFGLCPFVRCGGTTLWQVTGYRRGGFLLMAGTAIQFGLVFSSMLGLGRLIRGLFA